LGKRKGNSWYRPRTSEKVQNDVEDKFRKDTTDKLSKKTKGTESTVKETFDQQVTDDEVEAEADGDENGGFIAASGFSVITGIWEPMEVEKNV
jgi:oligoendopeptidase F